MAKSSQRAQKAGQKAAKRRQIVAQKKRGAQETTSLAARIVQAAQGPIVRCMRSGGLFDAGLGYVIVARELPTHLLSCAFFLVDAYCLGVKDILHAELSPLDFKARVSDMEEASGGFIDMDPPCARKLVRDAVAYAARIKLAPAKGFPVIEGIFGDVDVAGCTEGFTFGRNGKPTYVPGPNDNPARLREIMFALGEGQGDLLIPLLGQAADDLDADDDGLADLGDGPIIDHEPSPE